MMTYKNRFFNGKREKKIRRITSQHWNEKLNKGKK